MKQELGKSPRWLIAAIVAVSVFTLIMIVMAVLIAVDGPQYRNYPGDVFLYEAA
ncbi:MAG: hypothetical protein G01um101431_595 [Parcubacteria group bacterium Gr01-1014_31]|nr:MAG: hypothetical protein G01um101431_595 [Parcubacteria group bacterium Gr01-1014_31]